MPHSIRIGVLGSGPAGTALANGFLRHGYQVIRGSRDLTKLAGWLEHAGPRGQIGRFEAAARDCDIVVLAVKGLAAEAVIQQCKPANLFDKTVIDITNPIADEPPVHGVLRVFTAPNDSLMERLQKMVPRAHFVKAFSCVGHDLMVNPSFPGMRPTMFICGNNDDAKGQVTMLLDRFGWEAEDLGRVEAARAIEPLCLLWCARGWVRGRWDHAFKMLRVDRRKSSPQVRQSLQTNAWASEWQTEPFA